jgi:hypothetical protein
MNKIIVLLSLLAFISCNTKEKKQENVQVTSAIPHYFCENKCENSNSELAGNCVVCNNPLTHNQAFHAKDFLKDGPLEVESNLPTEQNNLGTSSPAVNQNGVYHYICNSGCPGGSGTANNCKSCGETLVHNTAYHN